MWRNRQLAMLAGASRRASKKAQKKKKKAYISYRAETLKILASRRQRRGAESVWRHQLAGAAARGISAHQLVMAAKISQNRSGLYQRRQLASIVWRRGVWRKSAQLAKAIFGKAGHRNQLMAAAQHQPANLAIGGGSGENRGPRQYQRNGVNVMAMTVSSSWRNIGESIARQCGWPKAISW